VCVCESKLSANVFSKAKISEISSFQKNWKAT
jgi:hypothetical protein